jgi:two-component system nitrogen regulation sensor histidine kinase NtrY
LEDAVAVGKGWVIGFWFGATMARDITDPLLDLAEGTEKITQGNLDVYIEPSADDELGVLVRSFNKMAADLRTGRDELMRVNIDLESRRKYMEAVLRNIAAGVISLDSEGKITTANDSSLNLLGIADRDLLGRQLVDLLPEASAGPIAEILRKASQSELDSVEHQITLSFPEKVISLICFASSLRDEEGHDLGTVLVFEDMTHLVKAQRMAAWREVARRIAHEIKNPLTPIQLNAQRLRRKYLPALAEDGAVLDQCTRAIIDQVEQLKNMVNEFSQFARMPAANPVPNDINSVIREVLDLYVQGNDRVKFVFDQDQSIPVFNLDKEQMKRAMVNLLDNAVSAIEREGIVRISTHYDKDLSIASIEVADNGAGINPHDRDRLFEPYFSRRPGGTGLGLTIVSTIVSDHNGFIRVKDNSGGGAKFILELPVARA